MREQRRYPIVRGPSPLRFDRRTLLSGVLGALATKGVTSALALSGGATSGCSPGTRQVRGRSSRTGAPEPSWGLQIGDVTDKSAVVWSRSDRPSHMVVQWSTSPSYAAAVTREVRGALADADGDFTAKVRLPDLPSDTRLFCRARFDAERSSPWIEGAFSTAPAENEARDVVFAWSADTNGQGWGIDPSRGGMPAFSALLDRAPDFFVSCGDAIYADDPIPERLALPEGGFWQNVVTPAKSHVAESLDDFRGAFLYPRLAPQVRALSAKVPLFALWDDHEVRNNWFPGQEFDDPAYPHEHRVDVLAARARRAMWEHTPTLRDPRAPMYRSVRWGARLEVFTLDGRSYRTPNEPVPPVERFLGDEQLAWLADAVARSTATWKVIACDMPIGLVVSEPSKTGSGQAFDGIANDNGPPKGREKEIARLLGIFAERRVRNVVWITADVHYAAAHRYDPSRAVPGALPFSEFVAGPMHATSFSRKPFDDSFGPELIWASADWNTPFGSPASGEQYFGVVRIDGRTGTLTVTLVDARGRDLHVTVLRPDI
ncbi:secreted alkaline phosphatase [Labilithrix luteola]|uniref:Secreted alkaline phosphatase n=1 Tax=Labilithrix luteola TaxID=1391654 RepID=A0A0K1QBM3_9BACT|nr:alkaline phosphatase D family protein [Labilithrix luteola]AKV03149.1 secreted alkaline phosphatase [Labilithrix luteola]